jgi:hypothetical protein
VKLTSILHLLPRSRMVETYPHFPNFLMTWRSIN